MQWDDLRYVLAISREGTLSRAAASLGVTHTTVGRRLRAIEDRLSVRLFDRTPHGFAPTPAGQDIHDVAAKMEADVRSVEGRVLGRDVQLKGELRVSTLELLFVCFNSAFSSFAERYPLVDLTLSLTDDPVSLIRREADVALRVTGAPPEYLVGRKVAQVRYAIYGHKDLVQRIGEDAPYNAYPWLHYDKRLDARWMDDWLATIAPGAKILMRLDSSMGVRAAICEGLGLQLLACFDGDRHPDLVRVGSYEDDRRDHLWVLTLPELKKATRIQAFMTHVTDALRASMDAG